MTKERFPDVRFLETREHRQNRQAMRDAYAALRYPEFVCLIGGSFLLTLGMQIQQIALAYEIYLVTRDPLSLGLIGLAEAIPFISLALFGGHLADRFDKRRILQIAIAVMLLARSAARRHLLALGARPAFAAPPG